MSKKKPQLEIAKPIKHIYIVENKRMIYEMIGKYLEKPESAGMYNFPYKTEVMHIHPVRKFSKRTIGDISIDFIVTDLADNYAYVIRIAKEYNAPVVVVARGIDREVEFALQAGATAVFRYAFSAARDPNRYFIEVAKKIMSGETVNKKINFEKPEEPESKAGNCSYGFGPCYRAEKKPFR